MTYKTRPPLRGVAVNAITKVMIPKQRAAGFFLKRITILLRDTLRETSINYNENVDRS